MCTLLTKDAYAIIYTSAVRQLPTASALPHVLATIIWTDHAAPYHAVMV